MAFLGQLIGLQTYKMIPYLPHCEPDYQGLLVTKLKTNFKLNQNCLDPLKSKYEWELEHGDQCLSVKRMVTIHRNRCNANMCIPPNT